MGETVDTLNAPRLLRLDPAGRIHSMKETVETLRYFSRRVNTWNGLLNSEKHKKRLRLLPVAEAHLHWLIKRKMPDVKSWRILMIRRQACINFTVELREQRCDQDMAIGFVCCNCGSAEVPQ